MTVMNTTAESRRNKLATIEPDAANQWREQNEAVFVDVREQDEHARERIAGSVLIPLSTFDPSKLPNAHGNKIVVVCQSGQRSIDAAHRFAAAGVGDVHVLAGGLSKWRQSGLPTHVNRSAPLPIMRQVQIAAGSLVLLGVVLGVVASQWWLILSGFVGAGLVFAGISGFCGMANLLRLMPWNRTSASCTTD